MTDETPSAERGIYRNVSRRELLVASLFLAAYFLPKLLILWFPMSEILQFLADEPSVRLFELAILLGGLVVGYMVRPKG